MIRIDRAHLNFAAHTHAGMTGKNNEDRYAVTSYQLSESDATPVLFAVLADGIGGHRAGEVLGGREDHEGFSLFYDGGAFAP